MKISLPFIVLLVRPGLGEDCYFPYNMATNQSGQFGSDLGGAVTPCLIWFTSDQPGALRLDFNNKIFASKKEKKSCLSEYIKVQSGEALWKLCHSNVTTPIQIGVPGQSGHLDAGSPVIALVKWVGEMDISTSYLGRFEFVPLPSNPDSSLTEGSIMAERIKAKLDLFLRERERERGGLHLNQYQYLTAEECDQQQSILCQHSRFCAQEMTGIGCNSSLFMCIPRELGCDGELNCLEGDASDELGCYLPYVLFTTGGVVLSLTLVASAACLFQHHNMMVKNGMTRYNCDLVRRKDKVKARKADLTAQQPANHRAPSNSSATTSQPTAARPVSCLSKPSLPKGDSLPLLPHKPATCPDPVLKASQGKCGVPGMSNTTVNPPGHSTDNNGHKNGHSMVGESTKEEKATDVPGEEVRRHRRILADERDILREQRMAGLQGGNRLSMTQSQGSQCDLTELKSIRAPLGGHKNNGSVQSCDKLERRRRHTTESLDMSEDLDMSKGSYGYRFDFRSSCEFEFTEDAYI